MFTLKGTHIFKQTETKTAASQSSEIMATTQQLPHRAGTDASETDVNPTNDPASTTSLFTERLQAWKHMCGYLEDYISEVAKDQKSQTKDQEKILKALNHPLREGHHFDQNLGGVVGLFENLRSNTQAQINLHHETSKNLTGAVLPILERLHSEIKSKAKELEKGAGKGTKAVESARATSQKQIELLGQHSANFDTAGTKTTAATDPYVLQKGIIFRLNKQLSEENNNRGDLVAVQNSFQQFEAHVLDTVKTALKEFNTVMGGQADRQKAMYGDVANTATKIPLDFEWSGFLNRNGDKLINPNAPQRTIDTVTFPNQNHRATKALIEGSLERKGRGLGGLGGSYNSGYYAVTPAGYLHEFKDNDNLSRDPTPEHSLYLPDCVIGALDGAKFSIKGKDSSGGKLSQKMSTTSEYNFKAFSSQDAQQWYSIIQNHTSNSQSTPTSPVSPSDTKIAPIDTHTSPVQSQTASTTEPNSATVASPGVPQSATSTTAPPQHLTEQGTTTTTTSVPQSATSTTASTSALHTQPSAQQPGST